MAKKTIKIVTKAAEAKNIKKVVKKDKAEIHYTTVTYDYDYSDGLMFSTIDRFRVQNFKIGDEVEIAVRLRKKSHSKGKL